MHYVDDKWIAKLDKVENFELRKEVVILMIKKRHLDLLDHKRFISDLKRRDKIRSLI